MKIENPILHSMLDCDLYKINMGSVVFHLFPRAKVNYQFINRGKTEFPEGFASALRDQIKAMESLQLTKDEANWLKRIRYIRPTYIEWLAGYRMNADEVFVGEIDGKLVVEIQGYWYRTIFWEVKLMAVISELYFKMLGVPPFQIWQDCIEAKGLKLQTNNCHWSDFGTRRRFSLEVQDMVVKKMSMFNGFLGTSNLHLAHKYNVTPQGTYAHECIMAMSALYGSRMANKMWMKHWSDHFEGNVGVALTDTYTTDKFLQDFGTYEGRLFDGCRQDSGDPFEWGVKMLNHYKSLGIPSLNKRFVFSDNLNVNIASELNRKFSASAQPVFGIGTNFTNDVGLTPLNMVIKMTKADFGHGQIDVVKLSDDHGKHTGDPKAIELVKQELNIS